MHKLRVVMRRTSQNRLGAGGKRLLRCARGGAGTRPERKLRALECLLASACARPRVERQGGDPRKPRAAAPIGDRATSPGPNVIRLKTYVRVPRGVTRRISRRVLFARDGWQCAYCGSGIEPADARPRRATLARRDLGVGERRHVVRAVQPQQGRPAARGDEHAAADDSTPTDAGPLHPPDDGADPRRLADVPAWASGRRRDRLGSGFSLTSSLGVRLAQAVTTSAPGSG